MAFYGTYNFGSLVTKVGGKTYQTGTQEWAEALRTRAEKIESSRPFMMSQIPIGPVYAAEQLIKREMAKRGTLPMETPAATVAKPVGVTETVFEPTRETVPRSKTALTQPSSVVQGMLTGHVKGKPEFSRYEEQLRAYYAKRQEMYPGAAARRKGLLARLFAWLQGKEGEQT